MKEQEFDKAGLDPRLVTVLRLLEGIQETASIAAEELGRYLQSRFAEVKTKEEFLALPDASIRMWEALNDLISVTASRHIVLAYVQSLQEDEKPC